MGDTRHHDLVEITNQVLEPLRLFRGRRWNARGDVSRLDVRHHLALADGFHVISQPVDQCIPMTTKLVGVHVIGRRRSAEVVGIIRIR